MSLDGYYYVKSSNGPPPHDPLTCESCVTGKYYVGYAFGIHLHQDQAPAQPTSNETLAKAYQYGRFTITSTTASPSAVITGVKRDPPPGYAEVAFRKCQDCGSESPTNQPFSSHQHFKNCKWGAFKAKTELESRCPSGFVTPLIFVRDRAQEDEAVRRIEADFGGLGAAHDPNKGFAELRRWRTETFGRARAQFQRTRREWPLCPKSGLPMLLGIGDVPETATRALYLFCPGAGDRCGNGKP